MLIYVARNMKYILIRGTFLALRARINVLNSGGDEVRVA